MIPFLKRYQSEIVLFIGVFLISLLSFAIGFIVAEQRKKEPIRIEYYEEAEGGYCWCRNKRSLSSL